jgi:WS/DGAT/MGAT family acyltransferase
MRQRISRADLMQDAVGHSAATRQVGAVLVLGPGHGDTTDGDRADLRRVLGARLAAIPRFRQRLRRPPPGRGRPYWVADRAFDAEAHIGQLSCAAPGDERALLDLATVNLTRPLPRDRPLWAATVVTGLAGGRTGLVVVMDHVVADGVAGLDLLRALADPEPAADPTAVTDQPAPAESVAPATEPRDAGRETGQRAWRAGQAGPGHPLRRLSAGIAELGGLRLPRRLPSTSLNRPTSEDRALDVVRAGLAPVRDFAHANGGTVNDVLLAVAGGALRELLASRGEELREVCVSVPMSGRPGGDGELGNQVGVMPVLLPTDGDLGSRVRRAAMVTRERKAHARGASAALLVPGFLLLARVGLVGWFINRQRLIHTFLTNLRGPQQPLSIAGRLVQEMFAVPFTMGNVTVSFAVLSYAGALGITVLSDPARVPDAPVLVAALRRELSQMSPSACATTAARDDICAVGSDQSGLGSWRHAVDRA